MASSHYKTLLLAAFVIGSGSGLTAQVNYSDVGSTYSQNFNSSTVLADGANAWANNSTYLGWYVSYYNATTTTYTTPTTATATTGSGVGFNFYRSAGSTDIAFGGQATDNTDMGSAQAGGIYYGLQILNTTAVTLNSFTFGYTGEEWRRAGNSVSHTLVFSYSLNATSATDTAATWITVPAANFVGPQTSSGSTAVSIDGNLDANRVVINGITVSGTINSGASLWLRWYDVNNTSADHGLAIDDFSFTASAASAVPEPSTYAVIAGAGMVLAAVWKRRQKIARR